MDWLRPAFLWGLPMAAIPVAIHLLGRRKRRTVHIATLRFLERARTRSERSIKLRRLFLLAARVLAVLFLILLFSGPGVVGETAKKAGRTVIVVDTSLSMTASRNGPSRLDEAKKKLAALLGDAPDDAEFAVLQTSAGQSLGSEPFVKRSEAERRVMALTPSPSDKGIWRALETAGGLLAAGREGAVILTTDNQRHAWRDASGTVKNPMALNIMDVGLESPANVWLESADTSQGSARIKAGASGRDPGRLTVSLEMEKGKKLTAFISPGSEAELKPGVNGKGRIARAAVSPGGDISWDDEADLSINAAGPVKVTMVNGDPRGLEILDELHFVRLALKSAPSLGKDFDVSEIRQADLTLEKAAASDLLVLANPGPISPALASGIEKLINDGLGVVVAAGAGWNPDRTGDALADLLPVPLRDRILIREGDPSRPPFDEADPAKTLPPFDLLGANDGGRTGFSPRVRGYWITEPGLEKDSRVVMRLANQIPLLVEKRVGKGRKILLATTLDRDWSDLCLKPEFIPFLEKLFAFGAGRFHGGLKPLAGFGESLVSPFPEKVSVSAPDKTLFEWMPGAPLQIKNTGFYAVSDQSGPIGGFWARPDPGESDLTPLNPEELAKKISGTGIELKKEPLEGRGRRDYTALAAAALLAALFAEALLSARWRVRVKNPLVVEGGERP